MNGKMQKTIPAGGGVKATIWLNTTEEGNSYHSITVSRSYRTEDGQWKETNIYRRNDLPRIEYATRKAFDYLIEQQYAIETPDKEPEDGHAAKVKRGRAGSTKEDKGK